MKQLPTGTLTLLFTDIEGSTRLLERLGERYVDLLRDHHRLLRSAWADHGGHEVDTEGDAFFVVFPRAVDAVAAAVEAQRALSTHQWPDDSTVRVRMGMHTGTPISAGDFYVGLDIHRAARIGASAHGGQIILSQSTHNLIKDGPPAGVSFKDLGRHRLKDFPQPESMFQVLHADLETVSRPLKSLDTQTHNLPVQTTPLIGREQELAEIKQRLQNPSLHLLTLVGPGGTGKTRLALSAAEDVIEEFEHGVYLVPLASVDDAALIDSSIAQALGVAEVPGHPVIDALKQHLRTRTMLLILDNFEQVLGAADTVAELLGAAPNLTVLVTSREPLRLYGEHVIAVAPLATPTSLDASQSLIRCDSVRLFIERAQAVRTDFSLADENVRTVAEICTRLDGLPLAIELAAARVRHLPLQVIRDRLERSLQILTGGARDWHPRQQTLRNAIAWSYDLLLPDEQWMFRWFGVFAGGCTLSAVEEILQPPTDSDLSVLDFMSSLVDKSLLRWDYDAEDEPRLIMLGTIREYASELLASSGETTEAHHRHAGHYRDLATAAEVHLRGPDLATWLRRLDVDHDNLRAALHWSIEAGEIELGLSLAGPLARFWETRGYLSEGRERLSALVLASESFPPSATRAKALNGLASLAYRQADYDASHAINEQSLAIWRELGHERGIVASLNNLALIACDRGDFARARALFEEGLAIKRRSGDEREIADLLSNVALMTHYEGDLSTARTLFEDSLAMKRRLGDTRAVADLLGNLAGIVIVQGDHQHARRLLDESLRIRQEIGDARGVSYALHYLGDLAGARGDYDEACTRYRESLAIKREIGDRWGIAYSLMSLGDVLGARGEYPEARASIEESLTIREAVGDRRGVAGALHALADLALQEGDIEQARSLYVASLRGFEPLGDKLGLARCFEGMADVTHRQGDDDRAAALFGTAQVLRKELTAPRSSLERAIHRHLLDAIRGDREESAQAFEWTYAVAMPVDAAVSSCLQELTREPVRT